MKRHSSFWSRFDAAGLELRPLPSLADVEAARVRLAQTPRQAEAPASVAASRPVERPETDAERFKREFEEGRRSAAAILGKQISGERAR